MTALLVPPVAFLIYMMLSALLAEAGRALSPPVDPTEGKSALYAGGEDAPSTVAAPGYRPFFAVAMFFAVLHLGILILGTGELNTTATLFIGGLIVTLAALILG
jgi:NADH:ubiquinone oxidoreductase subunit 3 (subunit A)